MHGRVCCLGQEGRCCEHSIDSTDTLLLVTLCPLTWASVLRSAGIKTAGSEPSSKVSARKVGFVGWRRGRRAGLLGICSSV